MIRSNSTKPRLIPFAQFLIVSIRTAVSAFSCSLVLMGCNDRGVEEHRVQKGVEHIPEVLSDPHSEVDHKHSRTESEGVSTHDHDHEHADSSPSQVPDGWVFDPEPRSMRIATYIIPDEAGEVELAITRFPGRVGGELANINRWRGQMGLAPVSESELETVISRFEVPKGEGYETRIDSATGVMLASSVRDVQTNQTWFIRVTTTAESADRVQEAVFGFARTILDTSIGDG